jgi:hypothetical protein
MVPNHYHAAASVAKRSRNPRTNGAELITFFIVQPCDVLAAASGWNVMANKIWANFHGVYLVGMSMRSSSRRQPCIRSASQGAPPDSLG